MMESLLFNRSELSTPTYRPSGRNMIYPSRLTSIVSRIFAMTALFSLATLLLNRLPDTRGVAGGRGFEIGRKERNFLRGTGKYELTEFLFPSFIDSHSGQYFIEKISSRVKYVYPLLIHTEITAFPIFFSSIFIFPSFSCPFYNKYGCRCSTVLP